MQKERTILLVALILAVAWSLPAFGAGAPKYRLNDLNRQLEFSRYAGGDDEAQGVTASRPSWNTGVPRAAVPPGSPGYRVGQTTYDYQHNGSTGRQVDVHDDQIQVVWMEGTLFELALGRGVKWNKMKVAGSPAPITLDNDSVIYALPLGSIGSTDGNPAVTGGVRPGYTTFRNIPSGRGIVFPHDAPLDTNLSASGMASVDNAIAVGVFQTNFMPQPPGIATGDEVIWPHSCTQVVGTDTVMHAVSRGSSSGIFDPIYYWRGTLTGTVVNWEDPVYVDSTGVIAQIVEADPNSDNVAVIWPQPIDMAFTGGAAQSYNNIVYIESTDGGVNWSAEQSVTTQDTAVAGNFAYTDVDAVYDEDGTLHVVYNTRDYREDDVGDLGLFNIPARLWHWNDLRGTSRLINEANYSNACNEEGNPFLIGSWNLLMAKPNITVKPAGVYGADEILYAVWVQAGPTDSPFVADCATQSDSVTAGGYVNNELWIAGSSNDGLTWDRPKNVTGTNTGDGCTPGNCNSEHWVTAAARSDSGIYLSYTNDSHAGGIVQEEGAWSTSLYMLYVPEARPLVSEPRITVGPTQFIELNVAPSEEDTVIITLSNVGNADLDYTVTVLSDNGGDNYVTLNGTAAPVTSTILAAGAAQTISVEYFGGGGALNDPSENDWRLEVVSNDPANDPGVGGSAIYVDLNVFVATVWYTCAQDTISTGDRRLRVTSCMGIGNQGPDGGLYHYTDEYDYIFDASPVVSYNPGAPGPSFAYNNVFMGSTDGDGGLGDRSRDSNKSFRAQSDIIIARDSTVDVGDTSYTADVATGTATSTDSIFQIDWEVRTYKEGKLVDGMVAKYTLSEWADGPGGAGVINLGAAADLDADSLASWNDGIGSEPMQYIGAQGGYGNSDVGQASYVPQPNFAALFYIPLDTACDDLAIGGQVLDNVDYLYPENGYVTDTLLTWMAGMVGWNTATVQADTITDVNALLKAAGPLTWTGAETYEWAFGMAVSNISTGDLADKIARLRTALNPACRSGCLIEVPGDVNTNGSVTSSDVIVLVNYVFKGGANPEPCAANGDVNCNGSVTSADIIYEVNYVFKGGDPPCDICNESAFVCVPN